MKIQINNRKWKIKFVEEENENLQTESGQVVCGITHFSKATIYINKDIDTDVMLDTIIHELTHAYLFVHGFGQVESFNEENVCDLVGAFGYDLITKATEIYNGFINQI